MQKTNIPHILFIDDDNKIRSLVSEFLREKKFYVSLSNNTTNAKKLLNFYNFDLILLDIMMPKEDGVSFLKSFRRGNTNTPVLMLTAMKEIDSKINSFGIGCDDYLTKPFEPQELILRINKLLNPRVNNTLNKKIVFGDYEYNLNFQELRKNKELIKLTSIENEIMGLFCSNLNVVL